VGSEAASATAVASVEVAEEVEDSVAVEVDMEDEVASATRTVHHLMALQPDLVVEVVVGMVIAEDTEEVVEVVDTAIETEDAATPTSSLSRLEEEVGSGIGIVVVTVTGIATATIRVRSGRMMAEVGMMIQGRGGDTRRENW
jgi:hypothetical protein